MRTGLYVIECIRDELSRRGITACRFARHLDISEQSMCAYLRGVQSPSIERLDDMLHALELRLVRHEDLTMLQERTYMPQLRRRDEHHAERLEEWRKIAHAELGRTA